MFLDLNDPASIVDWWRVWPERHGGFLEQKAKLSPQFRPAISEAQRRIAASPELRQLLVDSVAQREADDARQAELTSRMSSVEMLRRELATG